MCGVAWYDGPAKASPFHTHSSFLTVRSGEHARGWRVTIRCSTRRGRVFVVMAYLAAKLENTNKENVALRVVVCI